MSSLAKTTASRIFSFKSVPPSKLSRAISTGSKQPLNDSIPDVSNYSLSSHAKLPHGSEVETVNDGGNFGITQAPNRAGTWSRSQNPKSKAMSGPRFEQTIMDLQPSPLAAIELVRNQPIQWTSDRTVTCNGGGGPLGHPRIYINTDKPEVCTCNYCGKSYVNRKYKQQIMANKDELLGVLIEEDEAGNPNSERIGH